MLSSAITFQKCATSICLASSWFMQNIKMTCMTGSLVYEVSNFHCFITEEFFREPVFSLQIYNGEKSRKESDHLLTLLFSHWRHRGLDVIFFIICRNIDAVKKKNWHLNKKLSWGEFCLLALSECVSQALNVCGLSLENTVGIKYQTVYTTLKIVPTSKRSKIMIHR